MDGLTSAAAEGAGGAVAATRQSCALARRESAHARGNCIDHLLVPARRIDTHPPWLSIVAAGTDFARKPETRLQLTSSVTAVQGTTSSKNQLKYSRMHGFSPTAFSGIVQTMSRAAKEFAGICTPPFAATEPGSHCVQAVAPATEERE